MTALICALMALVVGLDLKEWHLRDWHGLYWPAPTSLTWLDQVLSVRTGAAWPQLAGDTYHPPYGVGNACREPTPPLHGQTHGCAFCWGPVRDVGSYHHCPEPVPEALIALCQTFVKKSPQFVISDTVHDISATRGQLVSLVLYPMRQG